MAEACSSECRGEKAARPLIHNKEYHDRLERARDIRQSSMGRESRDQPATRRIAPVTIHHKTLRRTSFLFL